MGIVDRLMVYIFHRRRAVFPEYIW